MMHSLRALKVPTFSGWQIPSESGMFCHACGRTQNVLGLDVTASAPSAKCVFTTRPLAEKDRRFALNSGTGRGREGATLCMRKPSARRTY